MFSTLRPVTARPAVISVLIVAASREIFREGAAVTADYT
jgi:hypothetical protein